MAVVGKEAQRAELHKTIWRIANDLRGSVDGWDFKSYVLGMLFYRFISENLTAYLNEQERKAGNPDFDYATLTDTDAEFGREETVEEKGFYILPSELFVNVRAKARQRREPQRDPGAGLHATSRARRSAPTARTTSRACSTTSTSTAPSSAPRSPSATRSWSSCSTPSAISNLGSDFTDNTIDAFGDAYEYLMTMYASNAGKSGGEYFTPQEVSELLARITVVGKTEVNKVYDPACGSGSLLLKFAKVLGKDNVRQGFFGQEINLTTYNLAPHQHVPARRQLREVRHRPRRHADRPGALGRRAVRGDRLQSAVLDQVGRRRNPLLINDPRYAPAGVLAPKSKADLAFTMHMLQWLAVNGTAAIVEFPGVLYRGGAEQKIRKYLDRQQLRRHGDPAAAGPLLRHDDRDLHHRAEEVEDGQHVLFIDASAEFVRGGNKNKLTDGEPAEDPRRLRGARGRRPLRRSSSTNAEIADERLQHRGLLVRRSRGHTRGSRHRGARTPRSPRSSRARQKLRERDRRDRRGPGGRRR